MALTPGARLGVYEVTAQIGEGGMGQVYRATDTKLKRQVAIKILPTSLAADHDRLARFQREAEVLASLNHPNIAAIYGLEESGGVSALVMELVEGEDLSHRIARGAIPLDEALPVAKQIADALEAAHEQGIIHRDLKPANIKVREDGTVKVLDFGLAKALEPTGAQSASASMSPTITTPAMTQAGMILGTAAYMAPEQARGASVDKRADLWAFGVVLWEMLTGQRLFEGATVSDTLASVLKTEPEWNALPPATPAAIRRLLHRCLEKDRKRRLDSAAAARLEIEEALTAPSSAEAVAAQSRPAPTQRLAWSVAAVAVVAVAALAIPAARHLREAAPDPLLPVRFEIATPPTSDPFSFALSPDGRQLAYVAVTEGVPQLWVRALDQATAQPLRGTEGATGPFWDPDGIAIGFFADSKLKRIDLRGAAPQVLADVSGVPHGGTWNRDGVIVFAGGTGMMRVAATGGTPVRMTLVSCNRWPQFLPDGRRFLCSLTGGPLATRGIYIGALDGGEPMRVLPDLTSAVFTPPGFLLLVRQGVLVALRFDPAGGVVSGDPVPVAQTVGSDAAELRGAFAVSATGVLAHRDALAGRQLVWIDRAGTVRGAIGPPDENQLQYPELSPDGRRVAVNRQVQGNVDVWLIDVGREFASRFTFDPTNDTAPLWSPDGRRVVFRSLRNGVQDLFEKAATGAGDEQPLLVTPDNKGPQSWSRDGRFLLYTVQSSKTGLDLWALPMIGERTPFPVVQTSFDESGGQFSPDGRWVAYQSNASGRVEVYVRPFPGPGGTWQVSTGGGSQPRWRPDGQELFYVAPDNRLMAAPITAARDHQTIEAGAPVALFLTRLAPPQSPLKAQQYAVAPDGRFLMNVLAETTTKPITIVLNWQAALTK